MGTIRFLVVSMFKRGMATDEMTYNQDVKSTNKMAENVKCGLCEGTWP